MVIKEGLGEGDPTPRITVNGTGQEKTSCPIMGYGVVKRHLVVASQKNNKLGCFIKYTRSVHFDRILLFSENAQKTAVYNFYFMHLVTLKLPRSQNLLFYLRGFIKCRRQKVQFFLHNFCPRAGSWANNWIFLSDFEQDFVILSSSFLSKNFGWKCSYQIWDLFYRSMIKIGNQ